REERAKMSALVFNNPHLIGPLLEIAFAVDNPISNRACWVLEFTVKNEISLILPFIDHFTSSISNLRQESSIRPMAKICEILIKAYFSKTENEAQLVLSENHLEKITTACFDWLIGNHKVAAKAYSMTCLLLLGRKFDWIHPELKMVIEKNYGQGSAAYKARARHTLDKLKRKGL
ncbi:MAG: adenylosuccinate lyase, partial [Pricia sp.]|nr:adenylosuccinate lyase [Pricia sp.]